MGAEPEEREVYLVARAAHDGREDSAGRIIARETGLDQPRAIVAHQGSAVLFFTHSCFSGCCREQRGEVQLQKSTCPASLGPFHSGMSACPLF